MENKFFSEVKNNFGFGCMRLPMRKDGEVDTQEFCKMADAFIAQGFNYFDTAHGYISGKSELAIKECVSKRFKRDSFILTDKLTEPYFKTQDDIKPFFYSQLEACGVEYFDFYLAHALTQEVYPKFVKCNAFKVLGELKAEGKIRHVGFSFHDSPELLEKILKENPEVEVVQLQINYVDFEDSGVQGKRCYEICEKYNKPVIVMEPVKGGGLVNLPDSAKKIFDSLNGGSYASYAIRFAASFPKIFMVLSGMGSMEMMNDNLSFMKDFKPLSDAEFEAVWKVRDILNGMGGIPCTACRYCTDGCPKKILIPDLFSDYNAKTVFNDWNSGMYYGIHTTSNGKASDCIKCGKCEKACPQHLQIRELLKKVSKVFE
ncbi:hypothetical protein HNP77_001030 [Treponema rectale]|uniref:4Fe-4S ferredoxin-type domain-containing protein n=1 Tax=Treponema rectale TaxID=744512 RepID=A0A840SGV2_9SPIR|nr:aldo/keto reductase [Treponema rectale]MBB5218661.1 hypothetical protein [Treponema rectale]